jgi:acyl-CoA thioesterase-1
LRPIRIVLLGDELATGAGDSKHQGWFGRVKSRLPAADISCFELAKVDDTSGDLLRRWREEAMARFGENTDNYLIVALGNADVAAGITISRSRLNLASILDEAAKIGVRCLVIGPPPVLDAALDAEVQGLSAGFADVTQRRGLIYVDCHAPLQGHESWLAEISQHPRALPDQAGHGLIAWLVLNRGFLNWLGLTEAS